MRAKDVLGRSGEETAAEHLRASGCEILARNWRCTEGEIDIVARERAVLVICEVKTRSSALFGMPADAVTRTKRDRLRRLAYLWLQKNPGADEVRFDVISVLRDASGVDTIDHLRDAF